MSKTNSGNFFEDFRLGQTIRHATPRTVTHGDVALYCGLFGGRFAVQSSSAFAKAIGYKDTPVDDLLVFHIVFGKTVPDISLNAVANLGYAGMQFLAPVFAGDTITATSEVIGLKENSNRKTGIVYVRTRGFKQDGTAVLEYARWVMVRKRDENAPAPGDLGQQPRWAAAQILLQQRRVVPAQVAAEQCQRRLAAWQRLDARCAVGRARGADDRPAIGNEVGGEHLGGVAQAESEQGRHAVVASRHSSRTVMSCSAAWWRRTACRCARATRCWRT